ncbi:uncharacterized protein E5676_scaffold1591G00060 [Cucumis melo var. makuwa]|uniref:Uncharacterized protein n=1 Tax=Cucumis melo var. makuwa TaxID=1194695 RepID=A0A5A7SV71_CUCMM|nr:uncharacterized protein E6C27_scaffold845G00060 [Cucumis melo var. makuwa]TYK12425.1 uncharacterized protein E5676_scaffold1591G00060 [Cucumis melo var. makuwa]
MSYTKHLPQLLKSHQVAIVLQEPLQPPYLKWFNNDEGEKFGYANEKPCLFHPEIDDHFIEDCCEFKNECLPEFELNNWEIKRTLKLSKGSQKGTKVEGDIDDVVDFEVSTCNLKQNIEEDEYDISPELLRLIEQEKKDYVILREFEGYQFGNNRRSERSVNWHFSSSVGSIRSGDPATRVQRYFAWSH